MRKILAVPLAALSIVLAGIVHAVDRVARGRFGRGHRGPAELFIDAPDEAQAIGM
jgi:hypothetical protein